MTEKRNQRELLWFQTGGALNFITAAPHCGEKIHWKLKPKSDTNQTAQPCNTSTKVLS
jgi:hypothetical protein